MATIHEMIKSARVSKGWSMEKLAEEVSKVEGLAKPLTWQTVQQWERPEPLGTAPKRKRLAVVGELLGIQLTASFPVPTSLQLHVDSAERGNAKESPHPQTIAATLERLGDLLMKASPKTRAAVADLLARYAQDPSSGQSLARAIELLVEADQA
jgi:transcriptional regulator with XRE-family HTH domain